VLTLSIEGLEQLVVERIAGERVRAALAEHKPDRWLTSSEAAVVGFFPPENGNCERGGHRWPGG